MGRDRPRTNLKKWKRNEKKFERFGSNSCLLRAFVTGRGG
jgi:hypothetical protein